MLVPVFATRHKSLVLQHSHIFARVCFMQLVGSGGRSCLTAGTSSISFSESFYPKTKHPPPAPPSPRRPLLVVFVPRLQLLVPAGESNFTVYLRAYNSINNTISAKSSEYLVVSAPVLGSNDSLCPEDVPAVVTTDDDEGKELESSSPSPAVVELSSNASVIPGIIQVRVCFAAVVLLNWSLVLRLPRDLYPTSDCPRLCFAVRLSSPSNSPGRFRSQTPLRYLSHSLPPPPASFMASVALFLLFWPQ